MLPAEVEVTHFYGTAGTRRSAVARRKCHAAGTSPPLFLLILDPLLLLLLEPLLLDHEQLLLLLEPLLALVLESILSCLSSAAIHPVGTTASLAATTVSASEPPPGFVESDNGEATAAELLGAARLPVVVAASSFN